MARKQEAPEQTLSLDDLAPAEWNPREITDEALKGLGFSLAEFGDLSGIVWNRRSGKLVAGHQRMTALRQRYGEQLVLNIKAETPRVETPDGIFPVRVVDWEATKELAANLAANNPAIQGSFTRDAESLVQDLEQAAPDLFDSLLIGDIARAIDTADDDTAGDGSAIADDSGPPEMELQPFEHYDYILVLARSVKDWDWLMDRLQIERVDSSPVPQIKKIGLGRAIDAQRLIAAMGGS